MTNRTALLIIDIQRGFINEHTQHLPQLAEQKQAEYDFVWAAKLKCGDDSPFLRIRKTSGLRGGTDAIELAFTLQAHTNVLLKDGYSAVTPKLLAALKTHAITCVDIMGMDTDQCVLATALALFDAGITPRILRDCCASTGGIKMHNVGIMLLRRALGKRNIIG